MKAKIKPLIILIAIFAASLIAGVAAGCNIGESTPQDAANALGMTANVTYYANGGSFSDNAICYKTMSFKPGTPIFDIGTDEPPVGGSRVSISRTNYTFAGWVKADLDASGLPILLEMNEAGEITGNVLQMKENGTASVVGEDGRELNEQQKRFTAQISDNPTEWEFAFENGHPTLEDGEHLYLVAAWQPDVVLEYVLVSDEAVTFEFPKVDDPATEEDESLQTEEVVLNSGDIIKTEPFGAVSGTVTLRPNNVVETPVSNHSYIYLFWDEECTMPATSTYGNVVERPQDGTNAKIYAKYMPGSWTAVADSSGVRNMFNLLGSTNYYIVDDIDCSSLSLTLGAKNFSGTILGNGRTISNLKFSATVNNGSIVSVFGNVAASAVIKDLTIANIEATVIMRATGSVYALFAECAQGATFENFCVDGYSMGITTNNATIMNIQLLGDSYDTTNWLYGGYGSTDADFIDVYGEIVTNAALAIDEIKLIG